MTNVASTERTRLFVEGVPTAITAEVTGRRSDGLVVAQALPFLRLDTAVVAEGGTRARIAGVSIAMDGNVPRLQLELAHEASAVEATAWTPGTSVRRARADSTVPYAVHREDAPRRVVTISEPPPPPAAAITPPRREPWWARLARKLGALFAHGTRGASPALPPG